VHPRRVQPRPGSRLIDQGHPGGAGSALPPGAAVSFGFRRDVFAGQQTGVRERTESWRPSPALPNDKP
jgi:hypothetical protein